VDFAADLGSIASNPKTSSSSSPFGGDLSELLASSTNKSDLNGVCGDISCCFSLSLSSSIG